MEIFDLSLATIWELLQLMPWSCQACLSPAWATSLHIYGGAIRHAVPDCRNTCEKDAAPQGPSGNV